MFAAGSSGLVPYLHQKNIGWAGGTNAQKVSKVIARYFPYVSRLESRMHVREKGQGINSKTGMVSTDDIPFLNGNEKVILRLVSARDLTRNYSEHWGGNMWWSLLQNWHIIFCHGYLPHQLRGNPMRRTFLSINVRQPGCVSVIHLLGGSGATEWQAIEIPSWDMRTLVYMRQLVL